MTPVTQITPDQHQRQAAIDPTRSFIVQAPAGSGKTELLIQRYLRLLAVASKPESIVAITFTRKAAGEMRDRILEALRRTVEPDTPHERVTWQLAQAALRRDEAEQWNLLHNPGRMRVQTIDSLCHSIASQMPWLARMGAPPRIDDDARPLFEEAARRTVLQVETEGPYRDALENVLIHLDNDTTRLRNLIVEMLWQRDQWLATAVQTGDAERGHLEELLQNAIANALRLLDREIPDACRPAILRHFNLRQWPGCHHDRQPWWAELAELLLTKAGDFRKKATDSVRGIIADMQTCPGLENALDAIRRLPPPRYTDDQWRSVCSLLTCLKLAAAQLRIVFGEQSAVDFTEVATAARDALGGIEDPTDLAFRLDARIEHLLVDEYQDTSLSQMELLNRLMEGWQDGDGRTVFLVGDPMQSIYRFRQAEVGLFLETTRSGIGAVRPEFLQLSANYRSVSQIVDWVNDTFGAILPKEDNAATGAIAYSPSVPTKSAGVEPAITLHPFGKEEAEAEAQQVIRLIRSAPADHTIAVLVRARTHLPSIVTALRDENLAFRAVDIDSLAERPVVQDLLALTRALLHLADRPSWLAILRAPWCGISLHDLHAMLVGRRNDFVWDILRDTTALSMDGQFRAGRFCEVMQSALDERGRWPLRRWVERTWWHLRGPACVPDEAAMEDAGAYLDLLEARQDGCDLPDLDRFQASMAKLFARPNPLADERLTVMTIHRAKGLQFDTVIVPGLGRPTGREEYKMVLLHQGLVAPIKPADQDGDPIYDFIKGIEKQKTEHERMRLLYVGATRAKKRLHLLGHVRKEKPSTGSMLHDLWPSLPENEKLRFIERAAEVNARDEQTAPPKPVKLRRLRESWVAPELPPAVEWLRASPAAEIRVQGGDLVRHTGTAVHALLQRMADREPLVIPSTAAIRAILGQQGDTAKVEEILRRVLDSERGRWILSPHENARSEYAVSGVVDGQIVHGTLDRTFIDEHGTRWIIDYKSSLDAESELIYRQQLQRYARVLAPAGDPIRLAIYVPSEDHWKELT